VPVSSASVHPIERLRFVARASGADQAVLVRETAQALAHFRTDPQGLVTACRRVLDRQPTSGPLWWLCARTLCAPDPMTEAWAAADEIEADRTARELTHAIPDGIRVLTVGWPELVGDALVRRGDLEVLVVDVHGEGIGLTRRLTHLDGDAVDVPSSGTAAAVTSSDLVLLEASAVGPSDALVVSGSHAAAAVARHAGVPVWLTAGVGRLLPARVWEAIGRHLDDDEPWEPDEEVLPLDLVDQVVGPDGPQSVLEALRRTDCPVAPELLREL
jgi:hypothetical protein